MKMHTRNLTALILIATSVAIKAADFQSGSNGSYGELKVESANVELQVPPDGVFHCTSINIARSYVLRFKRNARNTPVYLLATSNVVVEGAIDVSGTTGTSVAGGLGGPGGFDGGAPGGGNTPGAGLGPGGGKPGADTTTADGAASGAYANVVAVNYNQTTNNGAPYGSPLLIPIIGGSGGGGSPLWGGGGGGGALLIASSTKITVGVNGGVYSLGGPSQGNGLHAGSGGAIRLVAPSVTVGGAVQCVIPNAVPGGAGRIRIDTLDRRDVNAGFLAGSATIGGLMTVFPDPVPQLDIIEAAGTAIAEGSGPVNIVLPFGSSPQRKVTVQARNFGGSVPISLVLTPDSGLPLTYRGTIDNTAANPATAVFDVTLPVNVLTTVNAYSR